LPFRARACRPARLLLAAGVTLLGGIVPARRAAAFGAMPEAITSYKIRVRYEPGSHEYTGQAQVSWINTAPEPVPDLQLHLYPNAFKNAASTYLRESENAERLTRLLAGRWAWLDITKLRLESGADLTDRVRFIAPDDGNADDRTVARVELPRPAAPGELVRFTVEFHGRMPPVVDRGGWAKDFVMAAQWYPKLGVYEAPGAAAVSPAAGTATSSIPRASSSPTSATTRSPSRCPGPGRPAAPARACGGTRTRTAPRPSAGRGAGSTTSPGPRARASMWSSVRSRRARR
jgi:hypothetical protein